MKSGHVETCVFVLVEVKQGERDAEEISGIYSSRGNR